MHRCPRCLHAFSRPSGLASHLNRRTPCKEPAEAAAIIPWDASSPIRCEPRALMSIMAGPRFAKYCRRLPFDRVATSAPLACANAIVDAVRAAHASPSARNVCALHRDGEVTCHTFGADGWVASGIGDAAAALVAAAHTEFRRGCRSLARGRLDPQELGTYCALSCITLTLDRVLADPSADPSAAAAIQSAVVAHLIDSAVPALPVALLAPPAAPIQYSPPPLYPPAAAHLNLSRVAPARDSAPSAERVAQLFHECRGSAPALIEAARDAWPVSRAALLYELERKLWEAEDGGLVADPPAAQRMRDQLKKLADMSD